MRPVIEGLLDGLLCVRIQPEDVDPPLREHSFSIDLPSDIQKKLTATEFVGFRVSGQKFTRPILAKARILPTFDGWRGCRLCINLAPEHVDVLRRDGTLYVEMPPDMRPRLAKVNCLDLVFHIDGAIPSLSEDEEAATSDRLVPASAPSTQKVLAFLRT